GKTCFRHQKPQANHHFQQWAKCAGHRARQGARICLIHGICSRYWPMPLILRDEAWPSAIALIPTKPGLFEILTKELAPIGSQGQQSDLRLSESEKPRRKHVEENFRAQPGPFLLPNSD
ncbi:MAG: hypothetical protein ABI191_00710, partial [Rhizomicrobium sp.]